jgi:outer membrane protein assembly factor BamB
MVAIVGAHATAAAHRGSVAATHASQAATSGAGESMFRGGPLHHGTAAAAGVETLGAVAWRFETGAAVRSSAALLEGTLYVGSSDHHLYAIDADTGNEVWRFAAGAAVTSSPAVDEERVVFADRDHTVYALARDDGSLRWKVETGADLPLPWGHEGWDYFTASPTLLGDRVLVGSGDGNLYALDVRGGSERWRFTAGARVRTTPAVAGDTVLFGDSAGMFYAIELSTGALRWRFETVGHTLTAADVGFDRRQIYSSAAVHDGVAYFGSRDALLYAVDIATGEELWRSGDGTSAWVISSPAVRDGRVYSARSSSTAVRALDARDGSEIWKLATGGAVFSSPVVAGQTVYLGNGSGWVMALDADDGSERWRYRTGGGVWATPLVDGRRLYVGSDDGFVYALEHTDGAQPRRAVFWEEDGVRFSSLGLGPGQRRILNHFERYGYETLSAATLGDFLRARIEDGVASVVVFAMDHLPEEVVEGPLETALYRRYLDAGGKIVWMGAPPSFYVFDEEAGQVTGLDPQPATAITGVDAADYRSDVYPVRPTATGRRWGLRSSWVGMGGFDAAQVDAVLAVDELGRAACWARSYGGPEGTGFVFIRPAFDNRDLDEIRAVAEYGVMRTPPHDHE